MWTLIFAEACFGGTDGRLQSSSTLKVAQGCRGLPVLAASRTGSTLAGCWLAPLGCIGRGAS